MAHRIIGQIVLVGSRVFGRAIVEAWRQAQALAKHQKALQAAGATGSSGVISSRGGVSLDEAYKILHIKPSPGNQVPELDAVVERYERLFKANDPKKGGSFYLQSKIHRARERIEAEAKQLGQTVKKPPAEQEGAATTTKP